MDRIKIATHQCVFSQDKWILKNIENSYPYVDKIYISYSQLPWDYNKSARENYENNTNIDEIKNSPFYDKVEIIYGDWLTETEQRNSCVDKAIMDGFDILIIQDTDEFYLSDDYLKIINYMNENPNFDVYKCGWYSFWKTLEWIVVGEQMQEIIGYPQIAINLKRGIRFHDRRNPNSINEAIIPDVMCYHLSFVLTDEECFRKLKTWGHSHEFNVDIWYQEKWVEWTPESLNLHPIYPPGWYKTVKNTHPLPKELNNI